MLFFHSKVDFTIGLLCERMARQPKVPRLNCVSFFRGVSSSFQLVSLSLSHSLFSLYFQEFRIAFLDRKKCRGKASLYKLQHVEVTYELITFTITKRKKLASENIKFNER